MTPGDPPPPNRCQIKQILTQISPKPIPTPHPADKKTSPNLVQSGSINNNLEEAVREPQATGMASALRVRGGNQPLSEPAAD